MKKLAVLFLVAFIVGFVAAPAMAAGKSKVGHLYLYEKTPLPCCDDPWPIVPDGAWGKMKYNKSGPTFDFVFNGHGLEPGQDYALIYYPDPWPGTGLKCIEFGYANGGGNVHIMGSPNTGDLPITGDENAPGAKIWLVLADDVNCVAGTWGPNGWNPTEYLFENNLITFDDTDAP